MAPTEPAEVVQLFLESLALRDPDTALSLVAPDIVYTNVSLPTLRGRAKTAKVIRLLDNPRLGFGVRILTLATTGKTVLTERIDELSFGPFRMQFWVCGRFEVRDGAIAVWRDYFDYFDMFKATLRGIAAMAVPSLQKPLPAPQRSF